MKDHGVQPEKLYETMQDEPEKVYPYVSLPIECLEGQKKQPGDDCVIECYLKIVSMDENSIQCKLIKTDYEDYMEEESEKE